jgi:hypothetical protein
MDPKLGRRRRSLPIRNRDRGLSSPPCSTMRPDVEQRRSRSNRIRSLAVQSRRWGRQTRSRGCRCERPSSLPEAGLAFVTAAPLVSRSPVQHSPRVPSRSRGSPSWRRSSAQPRCHRRSPVCIQTCPHTRARRSRGSPPFARTLPCERGRFEHREPSVDNLAATLVARGGWRGHRR